MNHKKRLQVPQNCAPGCRWIALTLGLFALIDENDFLRVSQIKWYATRNRTVTYAAGRLSACEKKIYLHRFLLEAPPGIQVDHRNSDGLDCRRSNLRLCTPLENSHNRRLRRGKTSRYKGVSWHANHKKWFARIKLNGKQTLLGYFDDERAAGVAYDNAAKVYFGDFARTNQDITA